VFQIINLKPLSSFSFSMKICQMKDEKYTDCHDEKLKTSKEQKKKM
jgi:hypothetical protein